MIVKKKLWLSGNKDRDQVGMPKINISFKWKWDEKEQRQEGKLLCSYINMYKTEFRWLEVDFAGALIMIPDCGVMIDYEEV